MRLATLTCHLRSGDVPVCMFHFHYIISEYLFFIWIDSFESRHFPLDRYVFMSVRQVYWKFCAQVHRDRDGRKHILLFSLFYKSKMFCYCECTQINAGSLQMKKKYSYLYEQKLGIILKASVRTSTFICPAVSATVQLHWTVLYSTVLSLCTDTSMAHIFSRLTLDWAVAK